MIQTNHFYNLDEGRMGEFDNRWNTVNRDTKFLENYQRQAPRQQIDFNTVNRMADQQRQMMPQLDQVSHNQQSRAPTNVHGSRLSQQGLQPPALMNGTSRVSNTSRKPATLNQGNPYRQGY